MLIIVSIITFGYIAAVVLSLYRVDQIDKELHELEKKEPGYKPGYTNIPGPM